VPVNGSAANRSVVADGSAIQAVRTVAATTELSVLVAGEPRAEPVGCFDPAVENCAAFVHQWLPGLADDSGVRVDVHTPGSSPRRQRCGPGAGQSSSDPLSEVGSAWIGDAGVG